MTFGRGEDRLGHICPGRLALSRHMKHAAQVGRSVLGQARGDREQGVGYVERIGWISALVGHDANFFPRFAQPQHGAHEIGAE